MFKGHVEHYKLGRNIFEVYFFVVVTRNPYMGEKKKLMNLWVNLGPILGQLRGVGAEAEEPKVESKDLAE